MQESKELTMVDYRPMAIGLREESTKLCDVVYYDVFDFNSTIDVYQQTEKVSFVCSLYDFYINWLNIHLASGCTCMILTLMTRTTSVGADTPSIH